MKINQEKGRVTGEREGERARETARERDEGWVRVTSRNRGGVRKDSRQRNDPQRSYTYDRPQRSRNTQTRWKDETDITSFYFTRFPEDVNEKDLWNIFREWGQVWEIFISKHRNKGGRRYGFVRFRGVADINRLER